MERLTRKQLREKVKAEWEDIAQYLKGGLCFDTLEGAEAMRDILNMIVSTT